MEASADSCSSFTCRISPSHAARSAVASVMPAPPMSFDRTVLSSAATRAMGRATKRIGFRALRDEGDVLAPAAEMKTTGEVVGDVVIQWVSRGHALGEIGFIVHPDHQGYGYATGMPRTAL